MPKRSYSVAFKQKAVQRALSIGNRPAAKELNVDEKRIREWRKQNIKFDEMSSSDANKKRRLCGGGKKPLLPEVELKLTEWIAVERAEYHRVTRKRIAAKAMELANYPNFKASRGWVDKFMRRNDFVIRQRTTTGQRLPPQLSQKVSSFVQFCLKMRMKYKLEAGAIGNMDETAIWADMPGGRTVENKGTKTVPVLTTGHEKVRITVCLAAMASGRKLPPLIVFKGKRMPDELKKVSGAVIGMSENGWMQSDMTQLWIKQCWGTFSFARRMLVWDSFRGHLTEDVKKTLKSTKTLACVIPGGCTKLVQPADVSWNMPFKTLYTELYETWLAEPARSADVTAAGNPRAPSRLNMVKWVKESWARLSPELIRKSFEACGITTHDADLIHCTKTGGVAEAARMSIQRLNPQDFVEVDLDVDLDAEQQSSSDDSDDSEFDDENDIEVL